jgi:RimJ/RimL family protein N-acetyltransferase
MTAIPHLDHAQGRVDSAVTYQVSVAGHLDDHWSAWLGSQTLVRNTDASTTLRVAAADQAQLHGVLTAIRDLGVELVSLHPVDDSPDDQPSPGPLLARKLSTERLTLRAATAEDAEATWAYRRLDSVNEWLTGVPDGFEDYRRMFAEPSRLGTTVIVELDDRLSGGVVGDFMLRREDAWGQLEVTEQVRGAQAELGWVLDPAHTGLGYATEAVHVLLRYCFEELGVRRVVATCFLDNDASWRLMERVGMRRETHAVAESLHRSGRWLDTLGYAVLSQEWVDRGGGRSVGAPTTSTHGVGPDVP